MVGLFLAGLVLAAGPARAEIVVPTPAPPPAGGIDVPPPADAGPADAAAPTGGVDVLEFVNRDKLHGRLVSAKPADYGLRWRHECSPRDIDFATRSIGHIKLAPRVAGGRRAHAAVVRLTNDDVLSGNILALDAEKLLLDTWYAGRMEIRRFMIRTLNPNATAGSVVYEGPNSLEEWSLPPHDRNRASWRFRNGTLQAVQSYPIGRIVEQMPDAADIELEIGWTRYPELTFAFFTDNIQNYYGNCYMMQMSGNTVHLYRCTRNGDQASLGRVDLRRPNMDMTGRMRLNILADRNRRVVALLLDGAVVQQWTDPGPPGGAAGKGILFQPQNQGNLRIHRIRIAAWDGKLPSAAGGTAESKEDLIRFVNGDKISGVLKTIAEGKARLETSYAPLDVPLERIAEISFSAERAERARRFEPDIRAQFADSGAITLRLDALENGRIMGYSENFGPIALPLAAFKTLRFNLYRETAAETPRDGGAPPPAEDEEEGLPTDPFEQVE